MQRLKSKGPNGPPCWTSFWGLKGAWVQIAFYLILFLFLFFIVDKSPELMCMKKKIETQTENIEIKRRWC